MNYIGTFVKKFLIEKCGSESDDEYKIRIKNNFDEFRWSYEAGDFIQEKGIGFFMLNYSSSEEMPNEILKKAFDNCADAIKEFESLLPKINKE